MSDENPKTWKQSSIHPSEDDLLCYIDGELPSRSANELRAHLEACWDCRNRAVKFQNAISNFIDYRHQVLQPMIEAPNNWRGFSSRLENQVQQPVPVSFWERWRTALGRLHSLLPDVEARTFRLAAISTITILIVFAGIYLLFVSGPTVVSAEELVERACSAREAEIKSTDQPVLYQQLRVRRRSSTGETTANVEIWQDIDNLRMRKVETPQTKDIGVPVINDLERLLRSNNYQPPPLSIVGFREWRNALADKWDSVETVKIDDGTPALRLQTESKGQIEPGRIVSSQLIVRANDYHPIEQHFEVAAENGEVEFDVRETSFAVMSLNSLNLGFFSDSTRLVVSSEPSTRPSSSESEPDVASSRTASNTTASIANGVATADLEMEVVNLLHNAGADLGEQIEVRRAPNGPVNVSGVVDTPERKGQILNALSSLRDSPAVRIQISTVAEYLAQQKQGKPTPRPSVENIEVESETFPAENDLRAHFKDDAAAKAFAARMTSRSSAAMNYLWAMKRLKAQFSLVELEKLSPDARAKWLGVVRSYARSYEGEIHSLKRELQAVFGVGDGEGNVGAISSDAELLQAIDQLFAAGTTTNQSVRTSLTTSSSGVNAIKSPQFWQQLTKAEALAVSIERAR